MTVVDRTRRGRRERVSRNQFADQLTARSGREDCEENPCARRPVDPERVGGRTGGSGACTVERVNSCT